jgi:hypothetical protein
LLIFIPVLAFVALHFVKIRPGHGGLKRAVVLWAALFICTAMVLSRFPAATFYPRNEALQRIQGELQRLEKRPLKKDEVVILIQGSSAVASCVKPALLERLLREQNLPARVFLLSEPGSNHFERIELLRQWFSQLTPAQTASMRAARIVLLNEILFSYDKNPLNGFVENAFGERSIAYTSPANAWPMAVTAWQQTHSQDPDDVPSPEILPLIAGHFLFNVFRVGSIPSVPAPEQKYSNRGAVPPPAPRNEASPAAPAAQAVTDAPREKSFDYGTAISEFRATDTKARPGKWNFPWQEIHDRESARVAATGAVDFTAWLTTPHLGPNPRRYTVTRLETLDDTLRFDGGSDDVLTLLDKPEYWRDQVHVTQAGGKIFTEWLAAQIAAAWPEISGGAR